MKVVVTSRSLLCDDNLTPQDQTAAEGEHVTLPCRVDNKVGNLQWTRDDFGLGLNRNLKGFER